MTPESWFGAIILTLLGGGMLSLFYQVRNDRRTRRSSEAEAPARVAAMSIEGAGDAVDVVRKALGEARTQIDELAAKVNVLSEQLDSAIRRAQDAEYLLITNGIPVPARRLS